MIDKTDIPVSKQVIRKLKEIPAGVVFDYSILANGSPMMNSLPTILSRLVKKGEIERLTKGIYFMPKKTKFGTIRPVEDEIIKSVTIKNNKIKGYLTGLPLYNRLGLTTQVSNILTIATNKVLPVKKIKGYNIKYKKQNAPITRANIPLLQLLDVIRDIREIPDTTIDNSFNILLERLVNLKQPEKKRLLNLATYYNPGARALTGAIFNYYFQEFDVTIMKNNLNPFTIYNIGISSELLPNKSSWNIQ